MRAHFKSDRFGKNLDLGGEQGADAERVRRVRDTRLPIADICAKLFERIRDISFQFGEPGFGFLPILRNDGADEIRLAWKMVMNARLANADNAGNIGITEAVI